ncbi:chitooligosaccharidolytic beta-N-acetylglucosaminidase [Anabrus simplex]|uniref:chitooligosaccharidolytic beta-N-acetylglucosaminidase n=1 Tax=Anabrus simplex TaxID=316456 RepID=UPI0035A2EDD9
MKTAYFEPRTDVMRLLIFVAIFSVFVVAAGSPVWTWTCKGTICEKVDFGSKNSKPLSMEECSLFCDPYGNVWPRPTGHIKLSKGRVVEIRADQVSVQYEGPCQLELRMERMINELGKIFQGHLLKMAEEETSDKVRAKPISVHLRINDTSKERIEMSTNESYVLKVQQTADGKVNVTITAPTYFGARHGLETLTQLVVLSAEGRLLMPKKASVRDHPIYKYRGILLDTARSFFPPNAIKRTLDAMAANKMNTFHWHMTDSHSFPFESKTYPNFSRYGAYSPKQIYTADDIRSIVEYGRVRGVRIIPEFDAPAHVGEGWQWVGENATVCFRAQPWTKYCFEPPCGQLNPTNDKVYDILGGLFSDFLDVFDSDIFHMGGDEVNLHCWNTSAAVTDWMDRKRHSRSEGGFIKLWAAFQNRAYNKLVAANGGKAMPVVLWTSDLTKEGRAGKYLDKDKYIIQVWTTNSDSVMGELVKKGFRVIFSNYDALYLDCGFGAWIGEGNNWCSPYIGWQKVYGNSPVAMLKKKGVQDRVARSLTLGAEATLFSEQADESALDGRLWPRAAALAERLWSDPSQGWKEAEHRMLNQRERLVKRGIAADTLQPEWCRQNQGHCRT